MNKILGSMIVLALLISCSSKPVLNDRAPDLSQLKGNNAVPLTIVNPSYPLTAALRGIGGWVLFEFNLNDRGKPIDLVVLDSHPSYTFVENASTAIKQWTFESNKSDKNVRKWYFMEFKLEE